MKKSVIRKKISKHRLEIGYKCSILHSLPTTFLQQQNADVGNTEPAFGLKYYSRTFSTIYVWPMLYGLGCVDPFAAHFTGYSRPPYPKSFCGQTEYIIPPESTGSHGVSRVSHSIPIPRKVLDTLSHFQCSWGKKKNP